MKLKCLPFLVALVFLSFACNSSQRNEPAQRTATGATAESNVSFSPTIAPTISPTVSKDYGIVEVRSDRDGTEIYLDRRLAGIIRDGVLRIASVRAGGHEILAAPGGGVKSWEENFVLKKDETYIARPEFKPVGATLIVSGFPVTLKIYVDEVFRGGEGMSIRDLTPGVHKIAIIAYKHVSWEGEIEIIEGRMHEIEAKLPHAAPGETPDEPEIKFFVEPLRTPAERAKPPPGTALVKGRARMHASPSVHGDVIQILESRTELAIMEGPKNGWYKVRAPAGGVGWVFHLAIGL